MFLEDFLTQPLSGMDALRYAVFFDFLSGASRVTSSILQAESYLRGTLDTELGDKLDTIPVEPIDSMIVFVTTKHDAAKNVDLLKQDPTGKLLLQHEVEAIGKEPTDFQDPNLVLKGANFAVQFYEMVYPLAEKVKKGQA